MRSAKARIDSAWWRHAPVVSASATGLAATVPYPTGKETAWRVGLEASWTLFDGGLRYGRLAQARADLAAAEAFETAETLRVSREARDAERDWDLARQQLALAEEQSRLGAEAASVAQRGLAAGTVEPAPGAGHRGRGVPGGRRGRDRPGPPPDRRGLAPTGARARSAMVGWHREESVAEPLRDLDAIQREMTGALFGKIVVARLKFVPLVFVVVMTAVWLDPDPWRVVLAIAMATYVVVLFGGEYWRFRQGWSGPNAFAGEHGRDDVRPAHRRDPHRRARQPRAAGPADGGAPDLADVRGERSAGRRRGGPDRRRVGRGRR